MKIMHVVQAPGGVERYLQMFFDNSKKNCFENIMICSNDYIKELYEARVAAFENVSMVREISLVDDFLAIIKVRKYIKKYKPDIIYCHSSKAGAIGRIARIGCKSKMIYNAHGWAFNMRCSKWKKKLYVFIERLLACITDKIICISDYEKESALRYGICNERKLKVIYNGIDTSCSFKNRDAAKGIADIPLNAFVIGMVGRISDQKAPDLFVEVAAMVKKTVDNAFFIIVGDGENRTDVEESIKKFGLEDRFLITGWVKNPQDYIVRFDIATLFSRWEGFGLVLCEYMVAQKPIIATNVDAIPNLITNGQTGILIKKDDANAAYERIIELYNDKQLRKRLAEEGYKNVVEKFTIDRVISEHCNLFLELLENTKK